MIDSATLTGAMVIALGSGATGVFCKNDNLWSLIEKSGFETGDRAWRMPHYKHYFGKIHIKLFFFNDFLDSISPTHNADLNNTGGREAGSATAAAFLADFVPDNIPYAHFDIAGVGGIFPQDGFHWSIFHRLFFAWVVETKLKTHLSQIRLFHICRKECLVDQPELSSKLLKIIIPE